MTELGRACLQTCSLYNSNNSGCTEPEEIGGSGSLPYQDGQGFFDHLSSPKDCIRLFNNKTSRTDRKDKNCGFANYPVTELGGRVRRLAVRTITTVGAKRTLLKCWH